MPMNNQNRWLILWFYQNHSYLANERRYKESKRLIYRAIIDLSNDTKDNTITLLKAKNL